MAIGVVENGQIVLKGRMWPDGTKLVVDVLKKRRSQSQNSYYWVYLGVIEQETGNNADDLHELFKRTLLPPKFVTAMGKEFKIPRSTTELNRAEFGEYMDKICALTNIPLPDIEAAGYIKN